MTNTIEEPVGERQTRLGVAPNAQDARSSGEDEGGKAVKKRIQATGAQWGTLHKVVKALGVRVVQILGVGDLEPDELLKRLLLTSGRGRAHV